MFFLRDFALVSGRFDRKLILEFFIRHVLDIQVKAPALLDAFSGKFTILGVVEASLLAYHVVLLLVLGELGNLYFRR
jgi:hypothetical protein